MKRAQFICAVLFVFGWVALAPQAFSQAQPAPSPRRTMTQTGQQTGQQTSQPGASKQTGIKPGAPLTADYDIGLIVKRLVALEARAASLEKQNQALGAQNDALELKNKSLEAKLAQLNARVNQFEQSADGFKKTEATLYKLLVRVKALEDSFQLFNTSYSDHRHYMPNIGLSALSSLPGMQQIANQAGVGSVKAQWDSIRVLWVIPSGSVDLTGTPYKQN